MKLFNLGNSSHNQNIYKYKVQIPTRKNKKKLETRIIMFVGKDLERLLDFYFIPYEKLGKVGVDKE